MSDLNVLKTIENLENIILLARETILEIKKTIPIDHQIIKESPIEHVELFSDYLKTQPKGFYSVPHLYSVYNDFCNEYDFKPIKVKKLNKQLKLLGTLNNHSPTRRIGGKVHRGYYLTQSQNDTTSVTLTPTMHHGNSDIASRV